MSDGSEISRFESFYRQEYQALYRYAYVWMGNAADTQEIVQESFLHFYQAQLGKKDWEYERALLFRLARNRAIDLLRRRQTRRQYAQEVLAGRVLVFGPSEARTPEEILLEKERQRCAESAFEKLGGRDQECLALRRSGLSYRAIAEVMEINPNSVSQMINRALRRFEQAYDAFLGKKGADETARKTKRG